MENQKSKPQRIYRNPIHLALEWQKLLTDNQFSRAHLARQLGISRARVTQVLRLSKLSPDVLQVRSAVGDPLSAPVITERMLRPIVSLPIDEQMQRVRALLVG